MIAVAIIVAMITLAGLMRRVDVYGVFIQGAWEGLRTAARVAPYLVGVLCAVAALRESGALDACVRLASPLMRVLGLPEEVAPLFFLRPLTGSGSLAMLADLLTSHGPDTITGLCACALMGSSETVFYTMSVYMGAAGMKKGRYALPVSLLAWLAGCVTAGRLFS